MPGPIVNAVTAAIAAGQGDAWWLLISRSDAHEAHLRNSMLGISDINEWSAALYYRFRREAGIHSAQIIFDNIRKGTLCRPSA